MRIRNGRRLLPAGGCGKVRGESGMTLRSRRGEAVMLAVMGIMMVGGEPNP